MEHKNLVYKVNSEIRIRLVGRPMDDTPIYTFIKGHHLFGIKWLPYIKDYYKPLFATDHRRSVKEIAEMLLFEDGDWLMYDENENVIEKPYVYVENYWEDVIIESPKYFSSYEEAKEYAENLFNQYKTKYNGQK
jgi:hypothetical protein